jgi:hypothetical protein
MRAGYHLDENVGRSEKAKSVRVLKVPLQKRTVSGPTKKREKQRSSAGRRPPGGAISLSSTQTIVLRLHVRNPDLAKDSSGPANS